MSARTIPSAGVADLTRQSFLLARRTTINLLRRPDVVTFIFVQPIIFVLLFIYVFGGAIEGGIGGLSYVDFAMPGMIVATLIFDAPATAFGLNEDMQKGVLDRIRSLPLHRAAYLVGRILYDSARALTVTVIIIVVGLLIGFRFHGGLVAAVGGLLIAWLFAVGIAWASANIGMMVSSPEAVQAAVFTVIFPFVFVSSVYVPVESMPGWLQAVARNNPVSVVSDAVRELFLGADLAGPLQVDGNPAVALAWSFAFAALFFALGVRRFQKLP
ncbi:MAG: ABC transporter permease [Nitriliruptorales bacterium]|nr:ABC transporter permease [Nitriliruptorales bacterium]